MPAQRPRIWQAVIAGLLLALCGVHAPASAQETNEIPPLGRGGGGGVEDPTDVVMESANRALVRVFSQSDDLARYFIDAFNWLVGRISTAVVNMLMGPDSPMAETLRPARDTAFFFGGGGPKKRVMKRIDLDSDGDGERGEEGEEQSTAGFQESYVVPLLGRRVTYDDMRYAERFVLDTVDVLKTWNAIMEKRKQQEQQQAQHFDL